MNLDLLSNKIFVGFCTIVLLYIFMFQSKIGVLELEVKSLKSTQDLCIEIVNHAVQEATGS